MTFCIGPDLYGLSAREIEAIAPLPKFKGLPRAPEYVLGLFEHRGQLVPAIDLSVLAGHPRSRPRLSTRVLLVRFRDTSGTDRLLGLVAEQLTDTVTVTATAARPSPLRVQDAPYLGELYSCERGVLQVVRTADLLPAEVASLLFGESPAACTTES